jgi:hypothetical protein
MESNTVDEGKLHPLIGQLLSDPGGASSVATVRIGDALGFYRTFPRSASSSPDASGSLRTFPSTEMKETVMPRQTMNGAPRARFCFILALPVPVAWAINGARAEQPPPPCDPNPTAAADEVAVCGRGDIEREAT